MGSALLDTSIEGAPGTAATPSSAETLRLQVAERLAAHRSRRGIASGPATSSEPARNANTRSARIAATVAERYAHTQSYRAFLAAEAERAVQQARAAAEVAERNARAVAAAQQRMLEEFQEEAAREQVARELAPQQEIQQEIASQPVAEVREAMAQELSLWPESEAEPVRQAPRVQADARAEARAFAAPKRATPKAAPVQPQSAQSAANSDGGLTVRFLEDATYVGRSVAGREAAATERRPERNDDEAQALDDEIAFRQAPVFEEPAGPPTPLPANLIEFPRQLVASRKARPRLAEGPLRDEAGDAPADGQLRIFEVDPAQIATSPEPESAEMAEPQWTSIWLDTPTDPAARAREAAAEQAMDDADVYPRNTSVDAPLAQVAKIRRRVLAAAINGGVISAGMVAFAAAFVLTTNPGIDLRSGASVYAALSTAARDAAAQPGLLIAGVVVAAFLYLVYQALFFSLSQATPGMRCARIALCTFDEQNPTRRARRRRMLAVLLSACPVGLGFLWAALDEDRLTWHDRMSKMYLRSY
jgi:uncharacterized RDD family membrane protein YckC